MRDPYDDLLYHANTAPHAEVCGLFVEQHGQVRYLPLRNEAEDTRCAFKVPVKDYLEWSGKGLCAIAHSHPVRSCEPSQKDRDRCNAAGVPFVIIQTASGEVYRLLPEGWKPGERGKTHVYGLYDCFSIVQDYYHEVHGADLSCVRPSKSWWGANSYSEAEALATRFGFQPIERPSLPGDVILAGGYGAGSAHLMVYLGDGRVVHHQAGRLSESGLYTSAMRRATRRVYRYAG